MKYFILDGNRLSGLWLERLLFNFIKPTDLLASCVSTIHGVCVCACVNIIYIVFQTPGTLTHTALLHWACTICTCQPELIKRFAPHHCSMGLYGICTSPFLFWGKCAMQRLDFKWSFRNNLLVQPIHGPINGFSLLTSKSLAWLAWNHGWGGSKNRAWSGNGKTICWCWVNANWWKPLPCRSGLCEQA